MKDEHRKLMGQSLKHVLFIHFHLAFQVIISVHGPGKGYSVTFSLVANYFNDSELALE